MQKLIYIAAVWVDVISNPSRYRLASRKMKGTKRLGCQLMRPAFLPGRKVIEFTVPRQV
jgi:hypothetical protein